MKQFLLLLMLLVPSRAFAAIAFGSCVNGADNSNAQSSSISAPQIAISAGDFVIAAIRWEDGNSVTATITDSTQTWNVSRNSYTAGGTGHRMWHAYNATANATDVVTFNFTGLVTYPNFVVCRYTGIQTTSNPLDQNAGGSSSGANCTPTSSSYTTTAASEVLIAFAQIDMLDSSVSPGSGYTTRATSPRVVAALEDQIVSSIQTGITTSMTFNMSATCNIDVATFKGAVTGLKKGTLMTLGVGR